jgi:DNA mismatch repair protein MutS
MTALAQVLERLHNVTMKVREWHGEVVFLHEVGPGAADRSYGVHVARLAGIPEAVVARAREVLERLEESEISGKGAGIVDDLPLFNARIRPEPALPGPQDRLAEALAAMNPDEMTPKEALEALYRLKDAVSKQ